MLSQSTPFFTMNHLKTMQNVLFNCSYSISAPFFAGAFVNFIFSWQWVDGSSVSSYKHWDSGQPSSTLWGQVMVIKSNGKWASQSGDSPSNYICQTAGFELYLDKSTELINLVRD